MYSRMKVWQIQTKTYAQTVKLVFFKGFKNINPPQWLCHTVHIQSFTTELNNMWKKQQS